MELHDFQKQMADVYGDLDRERGVPATVAWLTEELGELAQAVRKGTVEQQLHELGDVLAWLASLAEQLGLSLEDAAARYATVAPGARAPRVAATTDAEGLPAHPHASAGRAVLCTGTAAGNGIPSTQNGFSGTGGEELGDLDGVERGALAEVVVRHEQREAVVDGGVAPDPADVGRVVRPRPAAAWARRPPPPPAPRPGPPAHRPVTAAARTGR